jgi:Domain of unknown function (DUF4412)
VRTTRIAATLLFAAAASASAQFEGVADFKITTNTGQKQSVNGTGKMYVAPRAYRSEFEMQMTGSGSKGAPGAMKMTMFSKLSEPDKIYMLNDESKTYSVWDLSKSREDMKDLAKETYTVKKLGKDTVAGLSCQNALLTSSKGDEIEACVSRDFAASSDWIAAMNRGDKAAGSWIHSLKGAGIEGFPVRWSTRSKGSKDATMTMELTRIEKKSLPASLFEVPAGYKQTEMAIGGLTPEQQKQVDDAMKNLTPEQRKAYEDAMKRYAQPTPKP